MASDRHLPLRLVVWAPESGDSASRLPTLDPDSLYAASILQARRYHEPQSAAGGARARAARFSIAGPSSLIHAQVPCLEHGQTGVALAEGIASIEAYTQRWVGSSTSSNVELDEGKDTVDGKGAWAMHYALNQYMAANLHPLIHQVLFASDLFYSHTAKAYSGGLSLLSRHNLPGRIRRTMREEYVSRGRFIEPGSGLGPILCDSNSAEEVRNEEIKQREELARRAGITFNAASMVSESKANKEKESGRKATLLNGIGASRRVREATEEAGRAFGQLRVLSFAEQVFGTLEGALGDQLFLSGSDKPALVDLRLFSLLAPLLLPEDNFPVLAASPLPQLLRSSFPKLVEHTETVRNFIWPLAAASTGIGSFSKSNWPALLNEMDTHEQAASLSARFAAQLRDAPSNASAYLARVWSRSGRSSAALRNANAPRSTTSSTEAQQREAQRLQIGRWVWIASALIGLVGTAFASGLLAIDFVDEDEEKQRASSHRHHQQQQQSVPPRPGVPPPLTPAMLFERTQRGQQRASPTKNDGDGVSEAEGRNQRDGETPAASGQEGPHKDKSGDTEIGEEEIEIIDEGNEIGEDDAEEEDYLDGEEDDDDLED